MRLRLLLAASAILASSLAAHADSLVGATVDVQYHYPTVSTTTYDSGVQTVTNGLTLSDPSDAVNIVFGASTITIVNTLAGSFNSAAFNGLDIDFLSGVFLNSVSEAPSSSTSFRAGSVLSSTGNSIRLNLSGTCNTCFGGEQIVLNVNSTAVTAPTPEPSSLALLGTGVLAVAGAARRRFA